MSDEGNLNLGYMNEGAKKRATVKDVGADGRNTTARDSESPPTPTLTDDKTETNNPNPVVDVLSADIIAKPFSIVAGSAKIPHSKFNPFRKKSGLLNVLAKQAKVV